MGYPVYSNRFVDVSAGTGTYIYTVPAGVVAVFRWIDVTSASGSGNALYFEMPSGGNAYIFVNGGGLNMWHQEMRIVGTEFETFKWVVAGGAFNFTSSGFLLTTP